MSIDTARTALRAAVESCARSPLLPDRWVFFPGDLTKAADKSRLFQFRTGRWGSDSGLASATIVQREAVWDFRGLYSARQTGDFERLERVVEADLDLLANAFILPTAWLPHLDVCVPGTPRLEIVTGVGGETVGWIGVLPLTVMYRS